MTEKSKSTEGVHYLLRLKTMLYITINCLMGRDMFTTYCLMSECMVLLSHLPSYCLSNIRKYVHYNKNTNGIQSTSITIRTQKECKVHPLQ